MTGKGSHHFDSIIVSGALPGVAYKSEETMFRIYIFPMIKQLSLAIEDIQNDSNSHKIDDNSQIKSSSFHIKITFS